MLISGVAVANVGGKSRSSPGHAPLSPTDAIIIWLLALAIFASASVLGT